MRKLQVLFPEPQLGRLKEIAEKEDRPVSELVRESVRLFIERYSESFPAAKKTPPSFSAGKIKISADDMRSVAYADRINEKH